MAEAKSQAEPTMEEILASIRRIISEDDPAGAAPDGAQPDAMESAAAEPQAAAEQEPAPEPEPEPKPKPVEDVAAAEDNVLDLTQKLNEDGTVVDLAAERAAAEGTGEAAAEAEPKPEPEPAMAVEPEPEPEPEMAAEPEPEPEPEMTAEPEPEPEMVAETEPEAAAEPEPFGDALLDAVLEESLQEPAAEPAAEPAEEPESILAPQIQAATMGALGEITRAAASGRRASVHVGDGRTLEDIVREALTPELKAWLDANLAPLVEQIVRDEVKKMVRRAEEL